MTDPRAGMLRGRVLPLLIEEIMVDELRGSRSVEYSQRALDFNRSAWVHRYGRRTVVNETGKPLCAGAVARAHDVEIFREFLV